MIFNLSFIAKFHVPNLQSNSISPNFQLQVIFVLFIIEMCHVAQLFVEIGLKRASLILN